MIERRVSPAQKKSATRQLEADRPPADQLARSWDQLPAPVRRTRLVSATGSPATVRALDSTLWRDLPADLRRLLAVDR